MILLKSIGAFFTKIWRWIKETAWVQPLLIVGAIFAIIFSIPYITSWVQSWAGNSANSFYTSHQLTLNNQTEDSDTAADRLANSLYDNCYTNYLAKSTLAGEGYDKPTEGISFDTESYGTKFFVAFIQSSTSTSDMESGFKYLSDHWNDPSYGFIPHDDASSGDYGFKMYAIFTDEDSDNDSDYENDSFQSTAFYRFLTAHQNLFQCGIAEDLMDAPYYLNESLSDDNYYNLALDDNSSGANPRASFPVPTVFLVDYSPKAIAQERAGISEVIFTLDGSSQTEMAKNLMYMWNHTDSDSVDRGQNPFVTKNA